jgi:hypothetical protein
MAPGAFRLTCLSVLSMKAGMRRISENEVKEGGRGI